MTNTIDSKSMSKSHAIRVPVELVEGWISEIWHDGTPVRVAASDLHLANEAAQWGYDQREPELQERADQELEACCEWLGYPVAARQLRAARRPSHKPPTLAEQGLAVVRQLKNLGSAVDLEGAETKQQLNVLEEALNRLKELEAQQ